MSGVARALVELASSLVLLGALGMLWRRSLSAVVPTLVLQGLSLAAVAAVLGLVHHDPGLLLVALLVVAAKAALIPWLAARALAHDPHARESAPLVNVPSSLVGASALVLLAFVAGHPLVRLAGPPLGALIPLGLATSLIGLWVMTVRRRAVSQIVGLVLIDNGAALAAFVATSGVPLVIELGASLDVLLGVVVLRVLASRLSLAGVADLDELRELRG